VILDNLIARGQARSMVVVMPLGYGTMDIVKAGWQRVRDPALQRRNQELFRENLLKEVVPMAEKNYRISSDAKSRAIAGLSMGGAESLFVGLATPDRFAWIGAFSSGGVNTNYSSQFPNADSKLNKQLQLLWISCGREDGLFAGNKKFEEWLTSKDVRHTWVETPGQHSFRVWRRNLASFAPLLFQDKK
jgi:enterochelin esterase family protein